MYHPVKHICVKNVYAVEVYFYFMSPECSNGFIKSFWIELLLQLVVHS